MAADLSRRCLLSGGLLATAALAAGCRSGASGGASPLTTGSAARSTSSHAGSAPVDAALVQAEVGLIAAYHAALRRASPLDRRLLRGLLAQHRSHLRALGGTPAPGASGAGRGELSGLRRLETATQGRLAGAADAAPDGPTAALLAAIAASHAGHAVLLTARIEADR